MGRSIAIKLAILLVVAALVYSVFWFFKVGQVEKQINKFVSDNSSYISATEVTVSGFPLSQKITIKNLKFTIPNAALDKNEVIVPHLEATAGILASDYKVRLVEPVSVQDADGNIANVEFASDPEITVSIADGNIAQFRYQDSGYKIIAADKTVSYAATNTLVSIKSTFELDKETHLISISAKEIEGFDVMSLYKNILEKKVIDGIKTGEVALGNNTAAAVAPSADPTQQAAVTTPAADPQATTPVATTPTAAPAATAAAAPVASTTPEVAAAATAAAPAAPVENTNSKIVAVAATASDGNAAPAVVTTEEGSAAAPAPAASNVTKSDLLIEIEYVVSPLAVAGQQANVPVDPTQIQEAPSQHSKVAKITTLEFSNPLYTISVSGELSSLPDDNLPSGGVTIKVEKIDALLNQISSGFTQISDKMKPATPAPVEQPMAADLLSGTAVVAPVAPIEDPYQTFLVRVAAGLGAVTKEVSAKNAVSKDNVVQLDIRREKNLDFLINETSMREILGKF